MIEKKGFGEQLMQHWQSLPEGARNGLMGAGIGALGGGAAGAISSQFNPNEDERRPWASGVTGALAGGALGGGLGASLPYLRDMAQGWSPAQHGEEAYYPQLEGIGHDAVAQELASRNTSAAPRHALLGAAGATYGQSRDALSRGTAAGMNEKGWFPGDGNFKGDDRMADLAQHNVPSGTQRSAVWEALFGRRGGGTPNQTLSGWQEASHPSAPPPGGPYRATEAWEHMAQQAGQGMDDAVRPLSNEQVAGRFARGMFQPSLKGIGAGVGAAGLSMLAPYLAKKMLGNVPGSPAAMQGFAQ